MIFSGRNGLGDNVRVINGMYNQAKLLPNKAHFEVLWDKSTYYTLRHQDQKETYQYMFDYLMRFIPDRNFEYEQVLVHEKELEYHKDFFNLDIRPVNKKVKNSVYPTANFAKFKNFYEPIKNKLVIWRDTFLHHESNVTLSGLPKKPFVYDDWQNLIKYLQENFSVTEIEYRTPISEVMYHLSTCDFCIGIEGMWSVLANALRRPQICVFDAKAYPTDWIFWDGGRSAKHIMKGHIGNDNCVIVMNHPIDNWKNLNFIEDIYKQACDVNKRISTNDIFG